MALATAWSAVNPFGPAVDPGSADDPAVLRGRIVEAVPRMAGGGG